MTTSLPQAKLWQPTSAVARATHSEQLWRSLFYFNLGRLLVACGIVLIAWLSAEPSFGSYNPQLFLYTALVYFLFGGLSLLLIRKRQPGFDWQLAIQVCGDVLFLVILIYSSGGIQSGLGLLLLPALAAAGLISRGRLALFYASVASIGILLAACRT